MTRLLCPHLTIRSEILGPLHKKRIFNKVVYCLNGAIPHKPVMKIAEFPLP